jgi:hypothetical protein
MKVANVVKQVEEAVKNSSVISNELECKKYRISAYSFIIKYNHHYMINTTAEL